MSRPPQASIQIGDCLLDLAAAQLLRNGAPLHVRAKTFGVLRHLALNPGRVIGKDELFETLWPGLAVTEDTLTRSIRELRIALGPNGAPALRTVSRRGYVLDLPPLPPDTRARPALVVILPFATAPPDPADAALIDGIVEELTHAVARYGQVRVIACHTAFQFRPENTPPGNAASKLNADYFVEGAARRVGADMRLFTTLCETASDRQIWGETFTLSAISFCEVPTVIAHRIVSRLTLDVERSIGLRSSASGTSNLDAYQHFVAAVALLRQYGEDVNERARDHLDAALRLDPDFALAHAYRGLAEVIINNYGWAAPWKLEQALAYAQRALQIAPEEARCHGTVGLTRLYMRQHASAELHLRRAMELNPSDPDMMALMGYLMTMRGKPDEGISWIRRAMALNPLHPGWYHSDMASACHASGLYRDAIAHLQMMPRMDPWWHTRLAACHAALRDDAAAAHHLAQADAVSPGWDPVAACRNGLEVEHSESLGPILKDIERAMLAWRTSRSGRHTVDS